MKKPVSLFGPSGFANKILDTETFETFPYGDAPHGRAETDLPKVIPGFIDIHTHGGFGVDYMTSTAEEITDLCDQLAAVGYEGLLATTVTATHEDIAKALAALPEHPLILGIHLEGPFLSPKYPGAQPKHAIIDPPAILSAWDAVIDDPRLRVVTMAPERPGGLDLVRRLAERGVKVSLGHTYASYEEAQAAFAAGARHTTHTYNAMRPLHHREPGVVGFAMTNDDVFAELIYDRHHVLKPAAEVLIRCKPQDRLIAVSDSTQGAGLPSGTRMKMWNLDCIIGDGEIRLEDGTLAGSAITLRDACRNLKEDFGWDVAVRACCINPRLALGMDPANPRVYLEVDDDLNVLARHERRL